MAFRFRRWSACFLTLALAGCGGGGSDSDSGNSGSWLKLEPATSSISQYAGESVALSVTATASRTFTAPLQIAIIDTKGVITTQVTLDQLSQMSYRATVRTSATLGAGNHSTTLEVRICEDEPLTCSRPFPGSPWRLPLTVQVQSPTNLSTLQSIDGLGSWSSYQGNAAHTGFVPARFEPAAFSRRWQLAAATDHVQPYQSAAIDNGRVFRTHKIRDNAWELVAVSEDTGQTAWKVNMGGLPHVNPPAVGNGRVYVVSTGHQDSFLWVYDQVRGTLLQKLPMNSQWASHSAPTVSGTDVYAINGYMGGIAKLADGASDFSWSTTWPMYSGWSPATDGRFAYTYSTVDERLLAVDTADGSEAFLIGRDTMLSGASESVPVALTDDGIAIVAAEGLIAYNLRSRTRLWTIDSVLPGVPAVGNGAVYAFGADGLVLEARNPRTGQLLWASPKLGTERYTSVIVTRNLAFVSSSSSTKAVDLSTRQVVWTYPHGGSLAISARGVLTIMGDSGALAAVNLR